MSHQALRVVETTDFARNNVAVLDRSDFRFGRFCARPAARELTFDGQPVPIGSRAFDLLVVLLRSQGEVVSKDDIVRHVWPSTTVDESNLRFQMATLRKAIGIERERIKTIPGRGYIFTASDETLAPQRADGFAAVDRRAAIVIIEQDATNREALYRLLQPFHSKVRSFGSIKAFLESETLFAL